MTQASNTSRTAATTCSRSDGDRRRVNRDREHLLADLGGHRVVLHHHPGWSGSSRSRRRGAGSRRRSRCRPRPGGPPPPRGSDPSAGVDPHRVLVPDVRRGRASSCGSSSPATPARPSLRTRALTFLRFVAARRRAELGDGHGGLQLGHAEVVTGQLVLVAGAHALVADQPQAVGDRVVVGRDQATLARHQVLGRVQGEATRPRTTRPDDRRRARREPAPRPRRAPARAAGPAGPGRPCRPAGRTGGRA